MASGRWIYLAVAVLAALAGLEAAIGPFRAGYLNLALRSDCETGQRFGHFNRLYKSGIVGRRFARQYASEEFKQWPPYGVGFVLEHRPLWLGMTRDDFLAALGPADKSDSQSDTWYFERKDILRWHQRFPDGWKWEDWYYKWFQTLVAEYDDDGRLVRLGIPGMTFSADADQPAEWLPLQKSEIPSDLPPPPPEWTANDSGA